MRSTTLVVVKLPCQVGIDVKSFKILRKLTNLFKEGGIFEVKFYRLEIYNE